MEKKKRDPDERRTIPLDPETALRGALAIMPAEVEPPIDQQPQDD